MEYIGNIEKIEKYLPVGWESKAKELKAYQREGEIKTPGELLMLNLLHMTAGGSFQGTSSMVRLTAEMSLTKNAVYERIVKSGDWLKWMGQGICERSGFMAEKPEWLGDKTVQLVDASDVSLKGSKKSDWRLHHVFELFGYGSTRCDVTTVKDGEKLTRYDCFTKNDIVMGDRIYCTIQGIEHLKKSESNYILRFKSKAFTLYDEEVAPIELLPKIRHLDELESTSVDCFYKVNGKLCPIRICAMKKEAKAAEQAKRKTKEKARRQQKKTATVETLELNEYIVLATSLDYDESKIFELYRARWQIELVFRRLKSIFGFAEVPSKNDNSVKAWFYGVLFLAALCEAIQKDSHFSPFQQTPEL
jgi:hypothetical protein